MLRADLSVIILSYNTQVLLSNCLDSLVASCRKTKLKIQIIVIDNASTDDSPKIAQKHAQINQFVIWEIIKNKTNLGFAGGNNLGLKKAVGDYILFLNSDTEVYPEALEEAVNFIKKDSKIGAVSPKTMLFSGKMDPDCHRGFPTPWASISYFLGLERLFPKSRLFGQYHQSYKDFSKSHEIDAGFGTFMIIRKEVFQDVGEWDEKYFFYGEDLDYFYRIKRAGWKVMFYPKPLLLHHKGGSSGLRKESRGITPASKETRLQTAKASIKAMEIFYQKFYRGKYPFWATFLILAGIKIKGGLRLLSHSLKS